MKTYVYFGINDSTHEPINKTQANDIHEAAEKFAAMKQLPLEEFMSIFNVTVYGEETSQTSI